MVAAPCFPERVRRLDGPRDRRIPHGDILVEDGHIVAVGDLEVSDAEQIDATGMIVIPGFVDTHRHTWQTTVRGVLPSCTLDEYFAAMLGNSARSTGRRTSRRQLRRRSGGTQRRRHDAARLVARLEHARASDGRSRA